MESVWEPVSSDIVTTSYLTRCVAATVTCRRIVTTIVCELVAPEP